MPRPTTYSQVSLKPEAAAALKTLQTDLARHGTARLPAALGPFAPPLTLSDVVILGVKAARAAMEKGARR